MTGKLYLVATPIGNLEDISPRALKVLSDSNFILCEDTRTSKILLTHYKIKDTLISYHAHNEDDRIKYVISRIVNGENVALISDSGTPLISDPGSKLVRACIQNNIEIVPIPGANAIVPALLLSGFEIDKFYFEGFIPKKKGRQTRLKEICSRKALTVFYESPYRIPKLLNELNSLSPNSEIVLCRELTKKFEEVIRGKVSQLYRKINTLKLKGEFTIVFKP